MRGEITRQVSSRRLECAMSVCVYVCVFTLMMTLLRLTASPSVNNFATDFVLNCWDSEGRARLGSCVDEGTAESSRGSLDGVK